jgi:DNA-binding response OmpR family regulator
MERIMSTAAIVSSQAQDRAEVAHVVVVDGDPMIREGLADYLGAHRFRVTAVEDGEALLAAMDDELVDLVVFDVNLARDDGMALARRLFDLSAIPLIMFTGRCDVADRVMGLELGADDYVTKPYSPRELLARIRAMLRRRSETYQGRPARVRGYRFDGWELNLNTRRLVRPDGRNVELSNGEFSLLVAFLGAPKRILSRDQLLDMSRLHGDDVYDRAIDVQVMRLRRKLEIDPASPSYIRTERGVGYMFGVSVETVC